VYDRKKQDPHRAVIPRGNELPRSHGEQKLVRSNSAHRPPQADAVRGVRAGLRLSAARDR